MCGGGPPPMPAPPPVAPPPPPPEAPRSPLPEPEPVVRDVNPKVRKAKSAKAKNPQAKGTQALRIPLKPSVNTGAGGGPAGGLNQGQ